MVLACNTDLSGMWDAVPGWTSTESPVLWSRPSATSNCLRPCCRCRERPPIPWLRESLQQCIQTENFSVFLPRTMAVNKHGTGAERSELQRLRGEGRLRRGGTGVLGGALSSPSALPFLQRHIPRKMTGLYPSPSLRPKPAEGWHPQASLTLDPCHPPGS